MTVLRLLLLQKRKLDLKPQHNLVQPHQLPLRSPLLDVLSARISQEKVLMLSTFASLVLIVVIFSVFPVRCSLLHQQQHAHIHLLP